MWYRLSGAMMLLAFVFLFIAGVPTQAQEGNLTDGCVETYDPQTDYFPDKIDVMYAEGFEVIYHNHYKVVRVTKPWPGATEDDIFEYVLVQCGTPAPEGYENAQFIEVPAGDTIAMSTTQLPHLAELGVVDRLIGMDSFLYTNTPEVREKIEAGELVEVGSGPEVNIEVVLDAEPEIVMDYSSGAPQWDSYAILLDSGVFVAMNAEWVETSPLGWAEWVKFTSLFYNREAQATALFNDIEADYQELVTLTADIPEEEKPLVLRNIYSSWSEAWDITGGQSYAAQLMRDAGAKMVLGDDGLVADEVGSVPFDFEVVYDAGLEADIWLINAFAIYSLDDLLAADERYEDFVAFQEGNVYNNSARVNENGGNDFYESGVLHPEDILADLIAIFYPDLLPDHELIYYEKLQ